MATQYQSIDPKLVTKNAKKRVPMVSSTPAPVLQSLEVQSQQPQAYSTNIPAIWANQTIPWVWLTQVNQPIQTALANPVVSKPIENKPAIQQPVQKVSDYSQSLKDLKASVQDIQSIDQVKQAFPEFGDLDDQTIKDLVETTRNASNMDEVLSVFPELQGTTATQWWLKWQITPNWIPQLEPFMETTPWPYNPLKTVANLPTSVWNVAINLANMGLSPLQTAKLLVKTAVWWAWIAWEVLWSKLFGKDEYSDAENKLVQWSWPISKLYKYIKEWKEQARWVWEYFKGYWDKEELQRRVEEDPAWVISDLLTVAWYAWWAIEKVGKVWKLAKVAEVWSKIASVEKYDPYNLVPKTIKDLWVKAIPKIAKAWADVAVTALGKMTGTSSDTIREVYNAAAKWDSSAIEWMRWVINDDTVIENMKQWVQEIINDRKVMYGKWYEQLKKNVTSLDIKWVAKTALESLADMWIKFDKKWVLDFSESTITSPQARSNLQNIVDDIYKRKDTTPKWLDILKQRIRDYARYTPEYAQSDRIATMTANLIKDEIVKAVPEYATMTKSYEEVSNLLKELKQATWVGKKENIATIWTKLKWLLKDNQEVRKAVVQKMQEITWRNVLWQVAWLQMQPKLPRWLMGVWVAWWLALWQLTQLVNPMYLIPLLATSPRLIWEIANAMGVWRKLVDDYYNKFKSYFNKNGSNPVSPMNSPSSMGNWLSTRNNGVKPNTPVVVPPKDKPAVKAIKAKPKVVLWKEALEQNPVVKDFIYHWWEIDDYTKLNADYKFSNNMDIGKVAAEWPWIYFTSSSSEAAWYGSKIIKWIVSDGANIIDDNSKLLSRQKIATAIKSLPEDVRIDIAQDRDENISRWLESAIDSFVDWATTHDQLMNIWADVFRRRDVKWYLDFVQKLWIDWVKIKKNWGYHVVIYNKWVLSNKPKFLLPKPKTWN